jgi:hypothetical protein
MPEETLPKTHVINKLIELKNSIEHDSSPSDCFFALENLIEELKCQ